MVNAITLALERRDYAAGGLQVCESAPQGNPDDQETCDENARAYVASPSVVGVVGPLTSDCAGFQIPILNEAPGGAVPIVSPSASYVGLTRGTHAWTREEPDVYYPTGRRNFARTIPTDDVQAAAGALVARDLGVRRVYAVDVSDRRACSSSTTSCARPERSECRRRAAAPGTSSRRAPPGSPMRSRKPAPTGSSSVLLRSRRASHC